MIKLQGGVVRGHSGNQKHGKVRVKEHTACGDSVSSALLLLTGAKLPELKPRVASSNYPA